MELTGEDAEGPDKNRGLGWSSGGSPRWLEEELLLGVGAESSDWGLESRVLLSDPGEQRKEEVGR